MGRKREEETGSRLYKTQKHSVSLECHLRTKHSIYTLHFVFCVDATPFPLLVSVLRSWILAPELEWEQNDAGVCDRAKAPFAPHRGATRLIH
jgi:hypothetical protein